MLKKNFLLILTLCLLPLAAIAQVKMSGIVSDKDKEPIIGATVHVTNSNVGTITDLDGKYEIIAPAGSKTITISYVGMKSQTFPVKTGQLNVTLEDVATSLDEVVVIGYETVTKRDLTGSVSSVGGKALQDLPVASAAEAISGRLAGVQVTTTEGSPDAEVKIRIRGGGSITGDNSPLYLVDGFPVNSISDIPPSDIQSIDVLKDASSTAIYGARGANGVIIITTKNAGKGKLTVSLNSSFAVKTISKTLDVLDSYEFAYWQYEHALLQNKLQDNYINYFGDPSDMYLYKSIKGTDWQKEIFGNTGTTWNNNLSISGGSDKIGFTLSYNRIDDKAIMLESNYARNNVNFKLNANPVKWMKLDFTSRFSNTEVLGAGANEVNEKSSSDSRLKNSVIYTPIPLQNLTADSDDEEAVGNLYPPTTAITDNYQLKKQYNFVTNAGVSIIPIKNLTIRSEIGYEMGGTETNRYYGPSTYYVRSQIGSTQPALIITDYGYNRLRNTNTINYKTKIAKSHNLSVLLGEETLTTISKTTTSEVRNMPTNFTPEQSFKLTTQGTAYSVNNFYTPDNKLLSFFGRVNYDYKGKYLASATVRADGSSLFAPGNQWGVFPSGSFAWRMSEEDFMQGASSWLSNLKLRLSYGIAGNNRIEAGLYLSEYSSSTTNYLNIANSYWSINRDKMVNPDLKWETTTTRNLGIDFGFFNHRLSGTLDLYYNTTSDLLIDFPVSGSGYDFQTRNIGVTSNKGLEFTLNGTIVQTKNITFDVSANIAFNQNRVEDLGGLTEIKGSTNWASSYISDDYRVMVGQPIGLMYGYVTEGMYTTDDFNLVGGKWVLKNQSSETPDNSAIAGAYWGPGALKLKDLNGDGVITQEDRTVIGDANPLFSGGFSLNLKVYDFDLGANFSYMFGNDVYNANKIEFTSTNNNNNRNRNMLAIMSSDNRWSNIDPLTNQLTTDVTRLNEINAGKTMWSPAVGYAFHSWAVEDGSYLRLNNLTIGYSVNKKHLKKIHMQTVRVYATAYNLFCLTNYSGYDPEVDARRKVPYTPSCDYSAYPKSTSFTFGVNLTY